MKKSNEKTIHKSHFYFEPINKYHNISFTDIKDFTADEEYFIDILLVNKNRHRITINTGLIGFMIEKLHLKNKITNYIKQIQLTYSQHYII